MTIFIPILAEATLTPIEYENGGPRNVPGL
jgi:hypothetical protein